MALKKLAPSAVNVLVTRHETDVAVEPRRDLVVVAGAKVHIAAHALALAPQHDADLGVGLQTLDAVDHLDGDRFQTLGPADVACFVEPGLQFDDRRDVLALLGGPLQRRDNRTVAAGAIQDLFDRQHVRIVGRFLDQTHDRIETLVGLAQHHVVIGNRVENARVRIDQRRGLRRPRFVPQVVEASQHCSDA